MDCARSLHENVCSKPIISTFARFHCAAHEQAKKREKLLAYFVCFAGYARESDQAELHGLRFWRKSKLSAVDHQLESKLNQKAEF
jgi:hypothetical protein